MEVKSEIVIYKTEDGQTSIDVRMEEETVWLTQDQLVQLFQRDQSVISRHIYHVFNEGELDEKSNMQKMHIAKYPSTTPRPTSIWIMNNFAPS